MNIEDVLAMKVLSGRGRGNGVGSGCVYKYGNRFQVIIQFNGKKEYFGSFKTEEEARTKADEVFLAREKYNASTKLKETSGSPNAQPMSIKN